ncbi:MAG: GGDEF domain-containing protein [Chlamydiae bacterium]|nr:GGDEF domain-containing protein [Chlamydiota bacterium]
MIRGMDLDSCILIAAPAREGRAIVQCLKSGAYDTILTPVRRRWAEIVIARAMERRMYYAGSRLMERYRRMAFHDTLTGLHNHRYFQQQLDLGVRAAIRYGYPLTVMLIDLDDFKEYNDRHGHLEGDRALRAVGRLLGGSIRAQDTVARYGGEEFGLILPHTRKIAARHIAVRLCDAVEKLRCLHDRRRPAGPLTVSIGVATYPHDGEAPEALLGRADRALYAAKRAGKNRVRG